MKIIILLFLLLAVFTEFAFAQVKEEWVVKYNSSANDSDNAYDIEMDIDKEGNVYVAGTSKNEISGMDYLIIKYNQVGEELWKHTYSGNGNYKDELLGLVLDDLNNIYVTGYCFNTDTEKDITTIKYSSNGEIEWVKNYNGSANKSDLGTAIGIDHEANIYVAGNSIDEYTGSNVVIIKYSSTGSEEWIQTYNCEGNSSEWTSSICIDKENNIIISGTTYFKNGANCFTLKYNTPGNLIWAKEYKGNGNSENYNEITSMVCDKNKNIYLTGSSIGKETGRDYLTIKYDTDGNEKWVKRLNGTSNVGDGTDQDIARDVKVDEYGNVFITGPSVGKGSGNDFLTVKYDSAGSLKWLNRYDGDFAYSLTIDNLGNVYVTGLSHVKEVFGKGICVTIKYDVNGELEWNKKYSNNDFNLNLPFKITLDESLNVYVAGISTGGISGRDIFTLKYSQDKP